MNFNDAEERFIKTEYEKLKSVIDRVSSIAGVTKDSTDESRQFVVMAGIEIYRKM